MVVIKLLVNCKKSYHFFAETKLMCNFAHIKGGHRVSDAHLA